ncbi:MAG: OmpH family outer membrane protein, partial [Phycisphaerales bacterium]|nr:OmpH family outer membrane protein [Phycisphaerales bacterium]
MRSNYWRSIGGVSVLSLAALAGAATFWQLGAASATAQGAPRAPAVSVAVVDIVAVINKLDERAVRQQELDGFSKERQDRVQKILDEVKKLADEIKLLPENAPERLAKAEQLSRLQLSGEAEERIAVSMGQERQKRMILGLYNKVVEAARAIAQREGIQIVMTDDSAMQIPADISPQDMNRMVDSRKVIFAENAVSITDRVIEKMNLDFKA